MNDPSVQTNDTTAAEATGVGTATGSVLLPLAAAMQWAEGERTPAISDALSRERRWIEPRRVLSENDGDVAGRLLVGEVRRLHRALRMSELADLLAACGVVDEDAVHDADAYDGSLTMGRIYSASQRLLSQNA